MIGSVRFQTADGPPCVATLDDRGRWSCPGLPAAELMLNAAYGRRHFDGPEGGQPGHRQVHEAAARLRGVATIELKASTATPDTVF